MRTVTVALLAGLGSALAPFALPAIGAAQAADLDYGVLRGPEYEPVPLAIDWSGGYFGAHGGFTSATTPFKNVYQPLVTRIVGFPSVAQDFTSGTVLSSRSRSADGESFGGYAGYNFVYDDVVLGFEVDYTRFSTGVSTSTAVSRQKYVTPGYVETADLTGSATRKIEDFGTVRVRAGYAIGSFLPFVTAGVAIGRMQIADKVAYRDYGYDQATFRANQSLPAGTAPAYVGNFGYAAFSQTNPDGSVPATGTVVASNRTKVVGGITLGAGLEYALTTNIVLRGEYQYVMFNDFKANNTVFNGTVINQGSVASTAISTVRGGAAIKF